MEELNIKTLVYMFRKVLCELHKTRSLKGQKTDWIDDLMSLSDKFNESKIVQVIKMLASANELEPVGIGQVAWIVKDVEFNKFDKKSMSRVNMYVEILMRLLRRYELVVFKKNGLYTKKNRDPEDDDEEDKSDSCAGMWLNKSVWTLDGFEIKPRDKEHYVWKDAVKYHGQMSGDKYTQQKCRNYDRCTETINLLNNVAYRFDKELCEYKAKAYAEPKKLIQWNYWEKHVMEAVYELADLDKFYVSFRPEKRLRCLIENDVGNYIMLKNVRHRIEFAENEIFDPDAVED